MSQKAKRIYTAGVVGVLALGMVVGGVVILQMRPGAATAGEGPPTPFLSTGSGQAEAGGAPVTPQDVRVGAVRTRIPKWQAWGKAARAKMDVMTERVA